MYLPLLLTFLATGCVNKSSSTVGNERDASSVGDAGATSCDQQLQAVGDALLEFAAANQNCTTDSDCVNAVANAAPCLGWCMYVINRAGVADATAYAEQLCAPLKSAGCWRTVYCVNYPDPVCDVDAGVCTPTS